MHHISFEAAFEGLISPPGLRFTTPNEVEDLESGVAGLGLRGVCLGADGPLPHCRPTQGNHPTSHTLILTPSPYTLVLMVQGHKLSLTPQVKFHPQPLTLNLIPGAEVSGERFDRPAREPRASKHPGSLPKTRTTAWISMQPGFAGGYIFANVLPPQVPKP